MYLCTVDGSLLLSRYNKHGFMVTLKEDKQPNTDKTAERAIMNIKRWHDSNLLRSKRKLLKATFSEESLLLLLFWF